MMSCMAIKTIQRPRHIEKVEEQERKKAANDTIAVIGLGYVGLPLAILVEQHGYNVIGFDIDEQKLDHLRRREADYLSSEESRIFAQTAMRITNDEQVLSEAATFIICVPTPVNDAHEPDFSPLLSAAMTVGRNMQRGSLVIVESTVNPGACDDLVIPLLQTTSGFMVSDSFYFAHCPERINPGDARYSVRNIPRVLGAPDSESVRRAQQLYESVLDAEVLPMGSVREAEAVKMVENSFRDINIAFVNELALAFEKEGIDAVNVIRGASTKPFAFMAHYPSCGVGGHCIPVDPYYLIEYGKQHGFTHKFLMRAREINDSMPHHTVELLKQALGEHRRPLRGSKIALLGLAYKKNISDTRESPALVIADDLKKGGAHLAVFDPHVTRGTTVASLKAALHGSDGVIIATDHDEFAALTPYDFERYGVLAVVDGKNCLDKDSFANSSVTYRGIGRAP
jgi:UDP-N-acetyl-D-glucosamine dehydrogenase